MRHNRKAGLHIIAAGSVIALTTLVSMLPASATSTPNPGPAGLLPALHSTINPKANVKAAASTDSGGESDAILSGAAQFAAVRTAPATSVSSAAFTAAAAQASQLSLTGGGWREVTNQPYNSDAVGYRDPVWSNSSGGSGLVSGRMTALAIDGGTIYAGAAGGGVWRSTNGGRNWTPVFDRQNNLSIGALAINPADHSVWVGTGEPNTSQDSYSGNGVYRSDDHGRTWQLVGDSLPNHLIYQITFDGRGHVYAATTYGLLRRSSSDLESGWKTVLKPDPNPANSPYRTSFITDVKVQPGTGGKVVIAALGWRGGTLPTDTSYNGFYESTDGGHTFALLTPTGDLAGATDLGRTTFTYSADGHVLYALVESSATVTLKGVYESASASPAGPWKLIANATTLAKANSAFAQSGGTPGAQAWYNQALIVDPANDAHLFVDLEEVYETTDAGTTWTTTGPYWNFPYPCWSVVPANNTCPDTTHSDQHALAISRGTLYTANDGGVYAHPLAAAGVVKWRDLNATLHSLQYYYAGIGRAPGGGGDNIWGGLQDNGVSLLTPGAKAMVSPFGGDGGDLIVNPSNGDQAVNEYVYLSMASTVNGGRSDGSTPAYSTISPSCLNPIFVSNPCDPNPRFIAPYSADITNVNHWVAGGEFVWDNQSKGWSTSCSATACDWVPVHDTGAGNSINAIAASGAVTYAGWCGHGCNPAGAAPFTSGIDTNYGGTWHTVNSPVLPNRIPTSFTIDPANPAHVVVTYGAFSRRWIPGGGVGHVFASWNGGASWTDVSGNLPDVPTTSSVLWQHQLVISTDIGVFATKASAPGVWRRLGSDLPAAPAVQVVVSPDQGYLLVATHGRGLWKLEG
ncbi:MAG TPA: hypothetical protein VII22_27700 [Streptosporangiaceae bacterium]